MRLNQNRSSVVLVLILANYLVFSLIFVFVFPPRGIAPPTYVAQPTFTPGATPLQRVEPLTYEFLTPSPTASPTATSTRRP
jgi:hypothetical protein